MDIKGRAEKFVKLVKDHKGKIAILISHIDPDSIGSALLGRRLVEHCGKDAKIYVAPDPGGQKRNEMVINMFGLGRTIRPIKEFLVKIKDERYLNILFDSPTVSDERMGEEIKDLQVNIVIDHHRPPEDLPEEDDAHLYWFESCGACTSLLASIFHALGISLDKADDADLATLAHYGILADTNCVISPHVAEVDYDMLAMLSRHSEQKRIHEIFSATSVMGGQYMKILHTATDPLNQAAGNNTLVVSLNEIPQEAEINMAPVADHLIATSGANTVYVWAIIKENETKTCLKIKVRSVGSNKSVLLDQHIKEIFGEKGGGAKTGIGGVTFDLGLMGRTPDRESLAQTVKALLNQVLLR